MPPATMANPGKRVKQACDRCRFRKTKVSTAIFNAIEPNADFRVDCSEAKDRVLLCCSVVAMTLVATALVYLHDVSLMYTCCGKCS
jgi:hypothetical protein